MTERNIWLDWAIELQSLAQAGLTYGYDAYDRERYGRIREIAAEMAAQLSGVPLEKVRGLFCNETGYQTPKLAPAPRSSTGSASCSCGRTVADGRCPAAGWT